jgi:hypothetical protein
MTSRKAAALAEKGKKKTEYLLFTGGMLISVQLYFEHRTVTSAADESVTKVKIEAILLNDCSDECKISCDIAQLF